MPRTISAVEAFDVKLPLSRSLTLGAIFITHRVYTVVRIHDSDGCTGTAVGLSRNAPVAQTVLMTLEPFLCGSETEAYPNFYSKVVASNVCLGTNGIFWRALSLADCAFYDMEARSAGVPLYRVLGGEARTTPCIAVGCYPSPVGTTESLITEVEWMSSLRPAGIKIGSCGSLERDTSRLQAARSVLDRSIPLMIDLYWQFSSAELLIPYARRWQEYGMGWIEDPFAFDDYASAARLAASISYPVAIGDEQSGQRSLLRLMDEGRVTVLRLDATVCGGITEFRQIALLAAQRNVPVSCHLFPELHAQLAAAIPNVRYVETYLPHSGLDSLDLINNTPSRIHEGNLFPSDVPGNGYTWDEQALLTYRTDKAKW